MDVWLTVQVQLIPLLLIVATMEAAPLAERLQMASLTVAELQSGLVALLPTLPLSTTMGEMRQQLAKHFGLCDNALDGWAETIGGLAQKILEGQEEEREPQEDADPPQEDADQDAAVPRKLWKRQYGGTWSHSSDAEKLSPKDMSKAAFGELLLRIFEQVFRDLRSKRA